MTDAALAGAFAEQGHALVAQNVGVRYDLGVSRHGTLRRAAAHAVRLARGRVRHVDFWAIRQVGFELRRGEILGIVGRNGSGKSTLLLSLGGVLPPDEGLIATFGMRPTLLTLGAGFEEELTGRDNIYLNAAYLGFRRDAIEEQLDDIIEFSELGDFIDVELRKYSTGMRSRLGFSIAAHTEPDVLLIDELLGVGDASFQAKSQKKMLELVKSAHAIVIVSHSMPFLREISDRVMWLEDGRVVAIGNPDTVTHDYEYALEREAETNVAIRSILGGGTVRRHDPSSEAPRDGA